MNGGVEVQLRVNGRAVALDVEPRTTLADALRERGGWTGTHLGCEQGICGACTVILDGDPVRSCLLFAVQCGGAEVTTVEGLSSDGELSPIQAAFARHHGLQCGFCTPGFVVLATALLDREPDIGDDELVDALAANLCRCTGYVGIVEAVREVRDARHGAPRR